MANSRSGTQASCPEGPAACCCSVRAERDECERVPKKFAFFGFINFVLITSWCSALRQLGGGHDNQSSSQP